MVYGLWPLLAVLAVAPSADAPAACLAPLPPPPAWSPLGAITIGPHHGFIVEGVGGYEPALFSFARVAVSYARGLGEFTELTVGADAGVFELTPLIASAKIRFFQGRDWFLAGAVDGRLQVLSKPGGRGLLSLLASCVLSPRWNLDAAVFAGATALANVDATTLSVACSIDSLGVCHAPHPGSAGWIGGRFGASVARVAGVAVFFALEVGAPFAADTGFKRAFGGVPEAALHIGTPFSF